MTINLKRSKEILSDKIAAAVDAAYKSITLLDAKKPAFISKEVMLSIL